MILQGSPSHWPISNRKVALIFLKLNSGIKNKTSTETKILKKMPCRRAKQLNLAEKQWTSYEVLSVDPFPIEKLHQFKRNWILRQQKMSTETKIFKKCNFGDRNDRIWLKSDEPLTESNLSTHFQSKSSTNVPQMKFWHQKQNDDRNKILKKMPCRMPKRWNLAEKWWTSYGVLSVDPFPIEKLHQFKWNRILAHKKNEHRNENF